MVDESVNPEHGSDGSPPARTRRSASLPTKFDLEKNMLNDTKVYMNLGQEIHISTRDKIELALRKSLPRYSDLGTLLSKAGIFLALLLALLTTDTKQFIGLSAEVWFAILILLTVVSASWALIGVIRHRKGMSVDDIVDTVIRKSEE